MPNKRLPTLKIGKLNINPPFILGGMGVRITNHKIVAAVANLGMAGTIASVGLCDRKCASEDYAEESSKALSDEIRSARKLSKGIIGVNIMCALTNYDKLVKTTVKEKADYIITGAGLPLKLPELVGNSTICLIPIVSSVKAARIIIKRWIQHYNRLPDAMIVEGAKAGGHLGMNKDEIASWDDETLLQICIELVQLFKEYEKATGKHIPVIAAGGIFDGKDVSKYLNAGIEGVQIATKFLATEECDAPEEFKQAVIDSKKEDMLIIDSPVGLPGRVIRNKFVEKIMNNEKIPVSCPYHCLKTCKPDTTPFCIAEALVNAQEGDIDNGIIMAGYNAYKLKAVVPVKTLVDELVKETIENIK